MSGSRTSPCYTIIVHPRTKPRPFSSGSKPTTIFFFLQGTGLPTLRVSTHPMDYAIKGIFKHRLCKKNRNLAGLRRAMKEEWNHISKALCPKTLRLWKGRVQKRLDNHGYQTENLKQENFQCCLSINMFW
jgi:hypothetical protein